MTSGFGNQEKKNTPKIKTIVNGDELSKLLKQYKKLKKYRKSSIFAIETMDGTENIISQLIKEAEENPM
jgi:hypothetical protein